jgi:hypothetical protein
VAVRVVGDTVGRLAPGPAPSWHEVPADRPGLLLARPLHREDGGASTTGPITGAGAAAALLQEWAGRYDSHETGGRIPLLIGLGVDEAAGLNRSARALLADRGAVRGPACEARDRIYQAGERIVLYGRSAPGWPGPGGTTGTVVEVDPRRCRVSIAWDSGGRVSVLDRTGLAHAGHAYAATPGLAGRMTHLRHAPILLLGSPDSVPLLQSRVLVSARAVAGLELGLGRAPAERSGLDRQARVPGIAP